MVIEHFKLGVQPFGVTPDAKFLYLSKTHREALASLFYGIHSGRGFTALIAPPGMGKTTLIFHLLGLLTEDAKTAFLFQTLCGPEEFLRALLADLGIDNGGDMASMHAKLNAYLLQESKNGRQVVVVIDEAQNLDDRVLELVRMLSNFETPGKKLMHLVLCGQPQLAERLSSEHLTQLRQRISIVARLAPFDANETREYIEHRLRVAGAVSTDAIFSEEAYAAIAQHSGGIPRNINNLCFNSMSLACALKQPQVDVSMVRETISDLDLTSLVKRTEEPRVEQHVPSASLETAPARSGKWPRRLALAAGLLISVAWLGGRLLPVRQDQVPSSPAVSVDRQNADSTADVVPAGVALAPQEGGQPVRSALSPSTDPQVDRFAGQTHRSADAANKSKAHGGRGATDSLALSPLPKDFERLRTSRVAGFTANPEVPAHTPEGSNQSSVPFDFATQREKQ